MKYYLRMVRPRFEVRLIEVDARSESEAKYLAMIEAMEPDKRWRSIPHNPNDYAAHVEQCESEHDFSANDTTLKEGKAQLAAAVPSEFNKYLLLRDDLFDGEGCSSGGRKLTMTIHHHQAHERPSCGRAGWP
jgi:hypothetical protein